MAQLVDFYHLLGVQPEATNLEVQRAYKKQAILFHPDKRQGLENSIDFTHKFTRSTEAYRVLKDPIQRMLYDLEMGFKPNTDEQISKLNELKKTRAIEAVRLMEESVTQSRKREEPNGLIILKALYGVLHTPYEKRNSFFDFSSNSEETSGVIDVTAPLQCLVEKSQLILAVGTPKSTFEGFYDPINDRNVQKHLDIQYKFLGKLHHCLVEDEEKLQMPMKAHLVTCETSELVTATQRVEQRIEEQRKLKRMRRRRQVMAALVIGSLCFAIGILASKKSKTENSWIPFWFRRNGIPRW